MSNSTVMVVGAGDGGGCTPVDLAKNGRDNAVELLQEQLQQRYKSRDRKNITAPQISPPPLLLNHHSSAFGLHPPPPHLLHGVSPALVVQRVVSRG